MITIFIQNILTYGVFVAFLLTLLEFIGNNNKHIEIFAFLSASFFIITFFQFIIINKINNKANSQFLIQTIIGGILWVLYSIIMYILFRYNFSEISIILITSIIILISIIIHYYLVNINFFKKIY